jgi:hypothetical protein
MVALLVAPLPLPDVSEPDPWAVLGIAPGSTLEQARAARRRLAKLVHPDLHLGATAAEQAELSARMTVVNRALAQIEGSVDAVDSVAAADPLDGGRDLGHPGDPAHPAGPAGPSDPDSFSVGWLPAEAFEALFLAAYGLGDILEADEPYLLELYLSEPACFCRLTLVPEAGGSLVTVDVSPAGDTLIQPTSAEVIAVLVTELNALVAG